MHFSEVDLGGVVNPSSPARLCTVARSGGKWREFRRGRRSVAWNLGFLVKGIGGVNGPRPEQYLSPIFLTAWPIVFLRDLGIFALAIYAHNSVAQC